jgi:Tfp pilus assembly protein PilE
MEVLTVLVVIGVLLSMAAPSFRRTTEQACADIAGAKLRAIWSAQRYYWLDNHTYATNLTDLSACDLLDSTITSGSARYSYSMVSADAQGFEAQANRIGSSRWTGSFTIDETGLITGTVQVGGGPGVTPGFQ